MKLLKRAQASGVEVSIFIMLMILFIIIYVILLPPAEREELLSPFEEEGVGVPVSGKILFSETPGKMFPYTTDKQENNLQPIHLFSKEETKTQALVKSLSMSRNILKDNYKNIYFDLPDLQTLKSLKLLFLITESKGGITVKLNNHIIFEGELSVNNLPLELPLDRLKKSKNTITLAVNSPMPNFLTTNYYLVEDINLIKIVSTATKKVKNTFYVDPELKVKSSKLSYFINCNEAGTEGTLSVKFNDNLILEDKVFCEYLSQRELELDKSLFTKTGYNNLLFEIDKGDYNIDKIKVKTMLSRASYPSYTFEVDSDTYKDVKDNQKHVKIYFSFNDAEAKKRATVSIQGREFFFETSGSSYSKDISNYIVDGSNYIRIIPKTEFEITSVKIAAE